MRPANAIEIVDGDRRYYVWKIHSRLRCVVASGAEEKRIECWGEIPETIRQQMFKVAEQLLPTIRSSSADPWSNGNFRLGAMDSCTDCPTMA